MTFTSAEESVRPYSTVRVMTTRPSAWRSDLCHARSANRSHRPTVQRESVDSALRSILRMAGCSPSGLDPAAESLAGGGPGRPESEKVTPRHQGADHAPRPVGA